MYQYWHINKYSTVMLTIEEIRFGVYRTLEYSCEFSVSVKIFKKKKKVIHRLSISLSSVKVGKLWVSQPLYRTRHIVLVS